RGISISAAVATWFLIATTIYIPIYRELWDGMRAAELLTTEKLKTLPPPKGATDLYFINLPFVNIYIKQSIVEAWGPAAEGMRCHVLTFAPDVLGMESSWYLTEPDEHTLRIGLGSSANPLDGSDGYFSGMLGRFLVGGMGDDVPVHATRTHDYEM